MRNKFLSLALACLLGLALTACKDKSQTATESKPSANASAAGSGTGTDLKVKWPVGSRYVYRMDLDQQSTNKFPQMPQPMIQNVTMAMTYAISAIKEAGKDGRELEMEFVANEMEVKMGEQVFMSFDSKESAKSDTQNPFTGPYRKMIGTKLRIQVDADGKLDEIIDLQEWIDKVTAGVAEREKGIFSQQFNEGYFRQIVDYGRALPPKPVQEGESWPFKMELSLGTMGKLAIDSKIKFKGWEDREKHKCVALTSVGTMKGTPGTEAGPMGKMSIEKGTATGTSWFDPELGAMIEVSADQTMKIKGEIPGAPGGGAGYTSDIGQKVTIKLVEAGKVK